MEILISQEDRERIASLAAAKTFGLIKDYLKPQQDHNVKSNKSYSVSEVAELFNVTPHTIRRWYEDDEFCLLKKLENVNKFNGLSVKAEYERRNGI